MIICAFDHGHLHIFARQFFCSLEAAKSRTDDDDARFSCERIFHTASFWQTFNVQRLTSNIQFSCWGATAGCASRNGRLSKSRIELCLQPYAEANCAKQNTQSSSQTFQNHGTGQSVASPLFATPFVVR